MPLSDQELAGLWDLWIVERQADLNAWLRLRDGDTPTRFTVELGRDGIVYTSIGDRVTV